MKTRLLIVLLAVVALRAEETGRLRAGAARVDITPAEHSALPMSGYAGRKEGFKRIHDHLFVRAVVVDDGTTQAAIVTCDLSAISAGLWERLAGRIEKDVRIPSGNVLLAATHTHAGPTLGLFSDDDPEPKIKAYAASVEDAFVEAVRRAQATLQPARVGAGAGRANVNVNRRARVARGGLWLGRNPEGPSDKTLAVVKFESLSGEPIAIFMNYGVHATVFGPKNFDISADLAGAGSRFVEAKFGDRVVAPWTSGAAGDQAPLYNRAENYDEVAIQGRILGEEALRVAATLRMSDRGRVRTAAKVVTCPGKKVPSGSRRLTSEEYTFVDADPVDIRLSLLTVNQVAFAGVSAEVLTMIGQRLKKESPLTHTIMVTNCNGSSGYIPDDAAYDEVSYEVVSARVKRGCAEDAIVEGFLDMIDKLLSGR